ncbi:MAG TPA: hypothetical protein PK095_09580 [Myxococcota bacterium]|nr:hypothetical protein [Myxococcota bacterium]
MKKHTLVSLSFAGLASACIDTQQRLDDFYDRSEPLRITVEPVDCGERHDISGELLLSIATVVNPSLPLMFAATFEVDTSAEPWDVTLSMQPLSFTDRSAVGEPLLASGTIANDGRFNLYFGEISILGAANPVVPGVDVKAELLLAGCTRSASLTCGNIGGNIIDPAAIPLAGSTYGAVAVDGDLATAEVVSACPVAE